MSSYQFANDVQVTNLNDLIVELQRAKIAVGDAPVMITIDAANKWSPKVRIDKAQGRVYIMAGDHL